METKIKATVYAAKLRKKLAELKAKREKDIETFKSDLAKWRKSMVAWLADNGKVRVDAIPVADIRRGRFGHFDQSPKFDASRFFYGAPQPPEYPSDRQIRDITTLLRHLAITGQETVRLTTSDVSKYLGDGEASEN